MVAAAVAAAAAGARKYPFRLWQAGRKGTGKLPPLANPENEGKIEKQLFLLTKRTAFGFILYEILNWISESIFSTIDQGPFPSFGHTHVFFLFTNRAHTHFFHRGKSEPRFSVLPEKVEN